VYYLQLHYLRLPKDIKESHVMLMDATVATGAAAMMAIRVLLDHDVPQENIILLSMLMGDSGKHCDKQFAHTFTRLYQICCIRRERTIVMVQRAYTLF